MCVLLHSPWRGHNEAKLSQTALFQLSSRVCQQWCCLLQVAGIWSEESTFGSVWSFQSVNQVGLQASYIENCSTEETTQHWREGHPAMLHRYCSVHDCVLCSKETFPEPLLNNTIQRRIFEIVEDIKQQVVAEIQAAPLKMFAI